ncbi:7743_t:CDS:2, partial [Funneliformis mosseae]
YILHKYFPVILGERVDICFVLLNISHIFWYPKYLEVIEKEFGCDKLSSTTKRITELYPEKPSIGIDIIIQPLSTIIRFLKVRISQSHTSVIGSGLFWDFLASNALGGKLKKAIHDNYKFWKTGQ